jgi:hypothetical protein
LPKGQAKFLDTAYFIPVVPKQETPIPADGPQVSRTVWLQNRLRAKSGGREVTGSMTPTTAMPDYQYFFVVLSPFADRYAYFKRLDTMVPPVEDDSANMMETVTHYRVVLPKIDNRVPLPTQPLAWTSIAYVLWDGLNPNHAAPQQQALLDWLHWGGQLIISGPSSLDLLRGSYLEPYLPATGGAAVRLGPAAFATLDEAWSVPLTLRGGRAGLKIADDRPLVGIELTKQADAEYVAGTGQLVVERRIGAGRIVVTAFSLSDRPIVNWPSYDSFVNGCLLRRPRRTFSLTPQAHLLNVEWQEARGVGNQFDGRFVTGLRYFSRDTGAEATVFAPASRVPAVRSVRANPAQAGPPAEPLVVDTGHVEVAAWNDRSGVADAARQSLRDAAGISVPKAGFVFRVLAIYLLILAPVNWGVFRALGRVEWAWIAAPGIAIVGAGAVVRLAQLDIGFARSRTEIAVLELHGGYARGHLTRYTALYTSLSTAYELAFEDESALALPFPAQVPFQRGLHDPINVAHFRRDRQVSLTGFQVPSNSTGLVHSEQMLPADGTLDLLGDDANGYVVRNATSLTLKDVGVVRRTVAGRLEIAWIGVLEPGESHTLSFTIWTGDAADVAQWQESRTTCSYESQRNALFVKYDGDHDRRLTREELTGAAEWPKDFDEFDTNRDERLSETEVLQGCIRSRGGQLTLGRLFDLASRQAKLSPGDVRLIGWTNEDPPGLSIRPRASQEAVRTMVLVHLRRGPLPPARPDTNTRADFPTAVRPEPLEDLPPDGP